MRKRLILVIVLVLSVLITLILYNLLNSGHHIMKMVAAGSSALPDTANATDIAWFKQPKATPLPAINKPKFYPSKILTKETVDERAWQAPISSNQIRVEANNKDLSQNINPTASKENERDSFLNTARQQQPDYLSDTLHEVISPYEIKTGTILPAILISGINSDLPGPITAQIRENVYDTVSGRYLLIPQGARLQGIYDSAIAYGQKRVLIAWQRLIFPNGQSLKLLGMPGTDASGYSGFHDLTDNHFSRLFGSALLISAISAGLQLSQPQSNSDNYQPTINQLLAQNTGVSLSQTTDQILRKNLNVQPTLEIRPGYLFNVSVTQDINLSATLPSR